MNNPPAFPSPPIYGATDDRCEQRDGMTLRDYFAATAVNALASLPLHQFAETFVGETKAQAVARNAYLIADAMLAEREKPTKEPA